MALVIRRSGPGPRAGQPGAWVACSAVLGIWAPEMWWCLSDLVGSLDDMCWAECVRADIQGQQRTQSVYIVARPRLHHFILIAGACVVTCSSDLVLDLPAGGGIRSRSWSLPVCETKFEFFGCTGRGMYEKLICRAVNFGLLNQDSYSVLLGHKSFDFWMVKSAVLISGWFDDHAVWFFHINVGRDSGIYSGPIYLKPSGWIWAIFG